MADLRERLIKFIMNSVGGCSRYWAGVIADGLMDNGVTDNNDGRKWISDRLPHSEFGESDEVLTISEMGVMRVLYFDGGCWCYPTGEVFRYRITHWMPLPEPPKEDA